LLYFAVGMAIVKFAATAWLLRQPDATRVTETRRGKLIYLAGKVSPALFVAAILARSWLQGAPAGFLLFCAAMLVVAIVMAVIVIRQRKAGTWYGLAHHFRQRRRR
jgi:hypothetical protein